MEEQEKQTQKGFNAGYLLAKYQPDLFPQTLKTEPVTPYITGLFAGKKQFEVEKRIDKDKQLKQPEPTKQLKNGPTKGK
jgi:hypothetical protein